MTLFSSIKLISSLIPDVPWGRINLLGVFFSNSDHFQIQAENLIPLLWTLMWEVIVHLAHLFFLASVSCRLCCISVSLRELTLTVESLLIILVTLQHTKQYHSGLYLHLYLLCRKRINHKTHCAHTTRHNY